MVRLAHGWREGVLPFGGGMADQPAYVAASIDIILSAWAKLRAARDKRKEN